MSEADRIRRIEQLRRQVDLLAHVRDHMAREPEDDFEAWAQALMLLTDRVLHELAKLEDPTGYVPYPHPMGEHWFVPAPWPAGQEQANG